MTPRGVKKSLKEGSRLDGLRGGGYTPKMTPLRALVLAGLVCQASPVAAQNGGKSKPATAASKKTNETRQPDDHSDAVDREKKAKVELDLNDPESVLKTLLLTYANQADAGTPDSDLPRGDRSSGGNGIPNSVRHEDEDGPAPPMKGAEGTPRRTTPFDDLVRDDPDKALDVLESARRRNPDDARLLALSASVKQSLGDRAGAVADARRAIALDPKNGLARIVYGYGDEAAAAGGRTKKLLKQDFGSKGDVGLAATSGAGAIPSPPPAEAGVAAGGFAAGGASAAQRAAAEGTRFAADSPFARQLASGWEGFRMGDFPRAVREATLVLERAPNDADAHVLRAAAFNRSGEPAKALVDAEEAVKAKPADPVALLERGYANYQLGKYGEALDDVERALSADPANAMGHLYKGMILEKLERVKDALAEYRKAGELDPSLRPLAEEAAARLANAPRAPGSPSPGGRKGRLALFGGLGLVAAALVFKGVKRAVHPSLATPMTPMR